MMQKYNVVVFDLDDTLYKEVYFLQSAFREIAEYYQEKFGIYGLWEKMMRHYKDGKDVFQEIIESYQRGMTKDFLLSIYRNHFPTIFLEQEIKQVLDVLWTDSKCHICIITDGRSITQRNKIKALGLYQYQREKRDFMVSEEHGHLKPDPYAFEMIESYYPCGDYFYIADNPKKDFYAPNQLGWKTICLLDNGKNIHKQDFNILDSFQPRYKIRNMNEALKIVGIKF